MAHRNELYPPSYARASLTSTTILSWPVAGKRHMYESMKKELYWPDIANGVYDTVRDCRFCAQNRTHANGVYDTVRDCRFCAQIRTHDKLQWQLERFFPEGPLKYIDMVVLGLLLKTKQDNHLVVVMTDVYTMLTKAILTSKTSATKVALILLDL